MIPVTKATFLSLFFLIFALLPVLLAWNQGVPVQSAYHGAVLYVSLAAFGILLGLFWLSRLLPANVTITKPVSILRWHKVLAYVAGLVILLHPVLIVSRRFWAGESDAFGNLLMMLGAPSLRPAIAAWGVLMMIAVLCLVRRAFHPRLWCVLHGGLSGGFAALATGHVVAVGRHSDGAMSVLWVLLAAGGIAALLHSYISRRSKPGRKETSKEPGVTLLPASQKSCGGRKPG